MKNGMIIIDKEQNKTSRDVVNEISKKFQTKKVGHTGTLDPLATGVLVIGIGEGTKLIPFLMSDEKEYIAEAIVGLDSDTLDVTGTIQEYENTKYSKEKTEEVLTSFIGTYDQEVPKYSAVHVNGKRLYEYARNQEEVALPKKKVEIKSIELLELKTDQRYQTFTFRVTVSKGTYIRSLIRDIGHKLGSPCIMKNLRRTRQGTFQIEHAKTIEAVTSADILSLKNAMTGYPTKLIQDERIIKQIQNGAKLPNEIEEQTCMIDKEDNLLAIYIPNGNEMKPVKVFHIPDADQT